jgi:transcriptional regulator with XRE-family HTH domain
MANPQHDWYLRQWLDTLHTRQSAVGERTGFARSKMSKLVSGSQPYDRPSVNAIARALNIEPYELLMHPEDAMRIRRLRDAALSIAADQRKGYGAEPSDAADPPSRRSA